MPATTVMRPLESRGLADIRHGSGTFSSNIAGGIRAGLQELRSMTETIGEMGHEPTMDRRALELRPATNHEAHELGNDVGDQVWSFERAVHADDEPVAFPTMSSPQLCYLRQRRIDPARSISAASSSATAPCSPSWRPGDW